MDPTVVSLSDREIVALTLIGEARGEPIESIVAVGCVIRNRLHSQPMTYKSYGEVCLRAQQFSCWNLNDTNYPYLIELAQQLVNGQKLQDPYLRQCILVANGIVDFDLVDNTKGADYYMVTTLLYSVKCPSWAKNRKNEITKGNHTFFSLT